MNNEAETQSCDSQGVVEEHVAAALHAVRLSQARPADLVAVVGEGPLVLATVAVLLARGVGKVVLLTDAAESGFRAARAGAQVFSVPTSAEALNELRSQLGGYGPDLVFEGEGNSGSRHLAIDLVRPAGMVVLLADDRKPTRMNPNLLVLADKRVQGSRRFDEEDLQIARDLIKARRLRIDNPGAEDARP